MIFDADLRPKSITLMRLARANGRFVAPRSLADVVPLVSGAVGDAKMWRPDLTTSQGWSFQSSVPQAPLAIGAMAGNHVRRQPVRLNYEAVITDTPMIPFGTLGGLPGIRRADALWASLRALYESRSFVAVVAPIAILENALIEGLTLNRTADDGSAYFISIEVVEQQVFELRLLPNIEDGLARNGAALTASSGVLVGGI